MEHLKKMLGFLREEMKNRDMDSILVADSSNLSYLTGMNDISGIMVIDQDEWTLHVSKFYRYAFKDISNVQVYSGKEEREELVEDLDGDSFSDMEEIGGREFEHNSVISDMRMKKKKFEIKRMKKACQKGDRVFSRAADRFEPGMSEMDVVGLVDSGFREEGVYNSFDTLAHRNTLEPHRPSSPDERIGKGDLVLVDMGCRVENYCSDMTRMLPNSLDGERRQLFEDLLEIQRKAVGSVREGKKVSDLVGEVREMVVKRDYDWDRHFLHSLGHGVGVDIHEKPFISEDSDHELEEGNVITIEPGLYVPGIGGARIEDQLVVKKDGCRVLTKSKRGM